ncbi:hypothetical protein FQR65_LT03371 [Abscondita terminalis]|nr:hypothetical protein FQR65_LT03371 [Abscondita terminalis]
MKPLTMCFTLNGKNRTWDLLEVHDSVVIILYNISRKVLVLVKQFRPAVYYYAIPAEERNDNVDVQKYPSELGVTIELCAGLLTKTCRLHQILSYPSSIGSSGSTQTAFYCEVTDDMKVTQGGGVEDESIEVVEMTVPEVLSYISNGKILSPPSFLFGIYWFIQNKMN